jgi:hypothetical protein
MNKMHQLKRLTISTVLVAALLLAGPFIGVSASPLDATAPGLGNAVSFSVIGKAGVTNTGNSVLSGSVGADSSITGFPPGSTGGTRIIAPAVNGAEADALIADGALTSQGPGTPAGPNLTGATLTPGVYSVGAALLPGTLTLNGPGVYIFLVSSSLTASGTVSLTNGARACDVFWHVTSGASITGGAFVGTIIAGTSVTFGNAASLDGRALALTGNVTLINNSIFGPSCAAATGPSATATGSAVGSGPTVTRLPAVAGIPNTGGGPIRNEGFPWSLVILGSISVFALVLGVQAYRRNRFTK